MSFNENLRGHTNSIILFILLNGDRHTDELKEIIDENFSTVKIGTLYSVIARMKTQGQIAEYRASSSDGSRRKYYKITDQGKKLFFDEYYNMFEGITLPEKQEAVNEQVENSTVNENEELYLKYIKKAENAETYSDIDFSSVPLENSKIEETAPIKEEIPKQEQLSIFDEELKVEEKSIDYDSGVSSEYEYKSVLNKLFPKSNKYNDDYVYTGSNHYDDIVSKEIIDEQPADVPTVEFDTIYDISEKENIKIRTSSDTNRYQGTKILANKLRFHSAVILLAISILEYLFTTLIFAGSISFDGSTLLKIALIFGSFTLVMGVIYAIKYSHSVKDLPKFINSIELSIVITIGFIIISLCVASINGINMYNFSEVYNWILLPTVMALNLPIYVAIVHFLSKLDIYQTV